MSATFPVLELAPTEAGSRQPAAVLLGSMPAGPSAADRVLRCLAASGIAVIKFEVHARGVERRLLVRVESLASERAQRDTTRLLAREFHPERAEWEWRAQVALKRVAVLVSGREHCLRDLLARTQAGRLRAELVLVASNHREPQALAKDAGLPFFHVPVTPRSKPEAERRLLSILKAANCDLVVLARYMQVLSGDFLRELNVPILNIHHSLLPAFAGADTYQRAYDRGVKLVGATAHYVTEELDAGPIIEQGVIRVDHRHSAQDLERMGAAVECEVLARAIDLHCRDRVIQHQHTTVVF